MQEGIDPHGDGKGIATYGRAARIGANKTQDIMDWITSSRNFCVYNNFVTRDAQITLPPSAIILITLVPHGAKNVKCFVNMKSVSVPAKNSQES